MNIIDSQSHWAMLRQILSLLLCQVSNAPFISRPLFSSEPHADHHHSNLFHQPKRLTRFILSLPRGSDGRVLRDKNLQIEKAQSLALLGRSLPSAHRQSRILFSTKPCFVQFWFPFLMTSHFSSTMKTNPLLTQQTGIAVRTVRCNAFLAAGT
jgi:hypothetical protein